MGNGASIQHRNDDDDSSDDEFQHNRLRKTVAVPPPVILSEKVVVGKGNVPTSSININPPSSTTTTESKKNIQIGNPPVGNNVSRNSFISPKNSVGKTETIAENKRTTNTVDNAKTLVDAEVKNSSSEINKNEKTSNSSAFDSISKGENNKNQSSKDLNSISNDNNTNTLPQPPDQKLNKSNNNDILENNGENAVNPPNTVKNAESNDDSQFHLFLPSSRMPSVVKKAKKGMMSNSLRKLKAKTKSIMKFGRNLASVYNLESFKGIDRTSISDAFMDEIRFIGLERLRERGEFPRFPDDKELTTTMREIKREESLVVFISHAWIRNDPEVIDYDGNPHPDTIDNDKLNILLLGLDAIMRNFATGMTKCFLWIDYCCVNQDKSPATELKWLDKLMIFCDCVFTPIHDGDYEVWADRTIQEDEASGFARFLPTAKTDANQWSAGQKKYMDRAWCQLETLYGFHLPLIEDEFTEKRLCHTSGCLLYSLSNGLRPHILYGTRDWKNRLPPRVLPSATDSLFVCCDPMEGSTTNPKDKDVIKVWFNTLQPFKRTVVHGYEGERKHRGERHGFGIHRFKNGDVFKGDFRDDFFHGIGAYIYVDGSSYKGDFRKGQKNGEGSFDFVNGDHFEGKWVNDKRNGHGRIEYATGDVYDGEWQEDCRHGFAVFHFACEDHYEGNYGNDLPNGFGVMKFYENSELYKGTWENGCYHGKGFFQFENRDEYEGDWFEGQRCGHGVMNYANGDHYKGEWKDDMLDGRGIYTYVNGDTYEGYFLCGLKDGNGIFKSPTKIYVGEWLEGKRHGNGRCEYARGEIYDGEWKDDKYCGEGTYWYENNEVYTGEFQQSLRHGQGTYAYLTGEIYEGQWVSSKRCGFGKMNILDTRWPGWYEGYWDADKRHGKGKHTFTSGDFFEGMFQEDQYHGTGKITYGHKSVYVGEFLYGKKNGNGVFVLANGSIYEGGFNDDKFDGHGMFKYNNGKTDVGVWKDGYIEEIFHQLEPGEEMEW